ncbi:MAG TPA: hypothetical protein VGG46_07925 [Terriglobales bacterium]|jgi:hypothetical protein
MKKHFMDDNLDRILSNDADIVPSSVFVRNMMAAIHREASTPAAISFPWRRVIPGLVISEIALTILLVLGIAEMRASGVVAPMPSHIFVDVIQRSINYGIGWIALGLVASFVPLRFVLSRK